MSIRITSVPGEHYHVYNRGVEKRIIFNDEHDYQRFLILMFLVNNTVPVDIKNMLRNCTLPEMLETKRNPLVHIQAFSLLPNHYHLLLSPVVENGVAKFMQKLATGYTMYFNAKNQRTGSLFQGKYKIKHAAEEQYVKYLFEYIHLNVVRERFDTAAKVMVAELLVAAEQYPWSSLAVYSSKGKGALAQANVDPVLFTDLFANYGNHKQLLLEWKETDEGSTFVTGSKQ